MADIAQDAALSADTPLLAAASLLFTFLWAEAWNHAEATLSGDAGALHDMRVAVRRLRSALENFEMDEAALPPHLKREFKAWRGRLAKLSDALGAVRDGDVLDDYLKKFAADELKLEVAASPGLAAFEQHLRNGRERAFGPMSKRIRRGLKPGGVREEFARWSLGLPGALPTNAVQASVEQSARPMLGAHLNEARHEAATLPDAADEEGHHNLRKALRRARYTFETLSVGFDTPVKPHVKKLTAIQDVLGEMQDRAVIHEAALRAFSAKAGREADLPTDVAALLEHGTQRRRALLTRARTAWTKLQSAPFFAATE